LVVRSSWSTLKNISIIIIIIIVVVDSVTILSICLLGNLYPSQIVCGIRLSQGKEIHPIPLLLLLLLYLLCVAVIPFTIIIKKTE
jgi:hypothetical protein